MSIRRVLVLAAIAAFLGTASPTMLAQAPQVDKKEQEKRNKQQQEDVTALVQLVDTAAATPASGPEQKQGDVAIAWDSNHFIRGQDGLTYVPFTVKVDRGTLSSDKAALYVRAVAKGAAPAPSAAAAGKDDKKASSARQSFPWDNAYFTSIKSDGIVQRAMALAGGEYDVFIAVKDQGTGDKKQVAKSGVLRRTLVIPNFMQPELTISSVMIGSVEPLAAPLSREQQQENPYVFGSMKIVPLKDPKLPKSGQLSLVFWIYGASLNPATKKPDVTIQYNFHQKTGDTEKFFNKTAPQELNATTLPPEFDVAAGHQLPGSLEVPLTSFPEGDYRLEITVVDKATGKELKQNVNFTVSPA